jgi:hypothetical protein
MNKKLAIALILCTIVFIILRQKVYKPYIWKKAINSQEHKLQLGSFIFSKQSGSNGSQSFETKYFVFKVIEINGDYVRLSVIRQLSKKETMVEGDFSTTSDHYETLKENIKEQLITPIQSEDLYKGEGPNFTLNDYLLEKYSDLKKSRYYYEDVSTEQKNKPLSAQTLDLNTYFSMIYSKKEIIENGELTPWTMTNSLTNKPQIAYNLSQNIDLILN